MIKIFGYELKRMLFNKFFLILLVVIGLYSWQVLTGEIILGVAGTAPFSPWSYGVFLSRVLPLLLIALLFFLTFLYSKKEEQVKILTATTAADQIKYGMVKCMAALACFLLLCLLPIGLSVVFYVKLFQYQALGAFILPLLLTMLPAVCFIFGLSMQLGRWQPNLLYVLMLLCLLLGFVAIPQILDLLGGNFYSAYPLTLPVDAAGEPVFQIPASFWLNRVLFTGMGIALLIKGIGDFKKLGRV